MKENLKARLYGKRYNIWKESLDNDSKEGYWLYNNKLYYGCRWFVFFESAQNEWFKLKSRQ